MEVKCLFFDLDFSSNNFIEKLFDGVFTTLPSVKSMQFYSNWLALNHKIPSIGKENILKKVNLDKEITAEALMKRLQNQRGRFEEVGEEHPTIKESDKKEVEFFADSTYEISLLLNHFFESLGLKVDGLEFCKVVSSSFSVFEIHPIISVETIPRR